jgi:poly(3-hydroxybutyrate) depolymerase
MMHRIIISVAAVLSGLVFASGAYAQLAPAENVTNTVARLIHYVAHDGVRRSAWLLLPLGYHGQSLPLVISPHGRGVDETMNAELWDDLPGEGGFAVISPAGEGRRLHWFSWGAPGQIADLARMPAIVEAHGVHVDARRIYAIGGSMGGQETLLLVAQHPHLLAGAGAVAFDPATDMKPRYYDFAALKNGNRGVVCPGRLRDSASCRGGMSRRFPRCLGARRCRPSDERGLEIGEQVFGRLDADRQAHEVPGWCERRARG